MQVDKKNQGGETTGTPAALNKKSVERMIGTKKTGLRHLWLVPVVTQWAALFTRWRGQRVVTSGVVLVSP